MHEKAPNRIAEHRKKKQMTQQQLADAAGVHWMTISKLERGKMQLTADWLVKLSDILGVPFQDLVLAGTGRFIREVMVTGILTNGMNVTLHPDGPQYEQIADEGADYVSQWFLVEGRDLEPFYFDGDAIRASYYWAEDFQYLVGRLAFVTFDNGPGTDDRTVFAIVEKHLGNNRFDLRSIKGIRIEDVPVNDIGIVTGLMIKGPDYPDTRPERVTPDPA